MKISNDIINNQESASKSPQKSPKNSTKPKVKIPLPKLKLPKKADTAHSNIIQNLIQRIPSLEGKSKAVKIGVIIAMVFLFGTATFLVHAIYSNATQTTQIGKRTGKNASLSSSSNTSSSSSSASAQSASSASKSDMTSANSVSTSSSAATSSSTVINDTSSSASSSSLSAAAESVQKRISASLPTLSIGSTTLKTKGSVTVTSTGDADQVTTTLASNGHSFATITTADGSDTLSLLPGYQSYVTEHVNLK